MSASARRSSARPGSKLWPAAPPRAVLIDGATRAALAGSVPTDAAPPAVLPGSPTAVPVHALKPAA